MMGMGYGGPPGGNMGFYPPYGMPGMDPNMGMNYPGGGAGGGMPPLPHYPMSMNMNMPPPMVRICYLLFSHNIS